MTDLLDIVDDWHEQEVVKAAVLKLIEAHQEEYDQLVGLTTEAKVADLERQIWRLQETVHSLQSLNPQGANVPALSETTNGLARENDRLNKRLQEATRKLERLEKKVARTEDQVRRDLVKDLGASHD